MYEPLHRGGVKPDGNGASGGSGREGDHRRVEVSSSDREGTL